MVRALHPVAPLPAPVEGPILFHCPFVVLVPHQSQVVQVGKFTHKQMCVFTSVDPG